VARDELKRENWLRIVARESDRSYKEMRVAVLEFMDADVFNTSAATPKPANDGHLKTGQRR
jgi:hypothetical protein